MRLRACLAILFSLTLLTSLTHGAEESEAVGPKEFLRELRAAWFGETEEEDKKGYSLKGTGNTEPIVIFNMGNRFWLTTGKSSYSFKTEPFWSTSNGIERAEFDDTDFVVSIIDFSMRVPYVKWLHVGGELAVFDFSDREGDYFEEQRDHIAIGTNMGISTDAEYDAPWNRNDGSSFVKNFKSGQINLSLEVLGPYSITRKGWAKSSLSVFAGWRYHEENFQMRDRHDTFINGRQNFVRNDYKYGNYEMDWSMFQLGVKGRMALEDVGISKGWFALGSFAYLDGHYAGRRDWPSIANSVRKEKGNADGWSLKLGGEYKRKSFAISAGYEWIWMECDHGNVQGAEEFNDADMERHGMYIRLGFSF